MKKNIFLFAVVLLTAFVGVSCSNEDILSEVPTPNPSKEVAENIVTFTATLDAKGGSSMRAVSASGATTWVENEEILISYKNTSDISQEAKATVKSVDANGKATITASLVSPMDGSNVYFYYPYESWKMTSTIDFASGQDGTLSTLSQYFDRAMDDSYKTFVPYTLSVSGGVATLPSGINMVNQNVIWKLSFTDGTNDITSSITKLEIHASAGGITDYTITPTTPITDYFYVAMGDLLNDDIVITAYTSTGMYRMAKSHITLEMGKIYTTTGLALNKVELAKLLGADGNIYDNAAAATTAGTTAVAIIAYVGSAGSVDASSATYKSLAIALSDANGGEKCMWYTANSGTCVSQTNTIATALGYKNGIASTTTLTSDGHTHAAAIAAVSNNGTSAPTGTSGWFLPSMGQWQLIAQGLATKKAGSAVTANLTNSSNDNYKSSNLNSVITDAGGTGLQYGLYWSSTGQLTSSAWQIDFRYGYVYASDKTFMHYVRSVLAF